MKSIKVVLAAYAVDDTSEGPTFAEVLVNQDFLDRLQRLVQVCKDHGLTEARVYAFPEWGPGNIDGALRLQCPELVVLPGGSFWFTDSTKSGGRIESRACEVLSIQSAFDGDDDGAVVILNGDPSLQSVYGQESVLG